MDYLKQNIDITNLSNFKTKAFTKYYYEINNYNDIFKLKEIYDFASKNWLNTLIVWSGTNLLFAFDKYNWIIIKNNLLWFEFDKNSKILSTYTSEKIWNIASILEENFEENIWHRFIWLPWSVWWAVFWNAGCFWLETENNFLYCEVYNLSTWEIVIFNKDNSNFTYRNSIFKETSKYFIIKVKFDLSKKIEKYHSITDNIKFRQEIQPSWNSCGSFFKNPQSDLSAWFLIESIWLKWYVYNNAYFSDKHANFLMTLKDNWDYKDLLYLIEKVQQEVKDKFDIFLENEVRIIKK